MKKLNGFFYDNLGNKSMNRLCFFIIHILVAAIVFYGMYEHYINSYVEGICLGLIGFAWTGKVTQAYKELTKNAKSDDA